MKNLINFDQFLKNPGKIEDDEICKNEISFWTAHTKIRLYTNFHEKNWVDFTWLNMGIAHFLPVNLEILTV